MDVASNGTCFEPTHADTFLNSALLITTVLIKSILYKFVWYQRYLMPY